MSYPLARSPDAARKVGISRGKGGWGACGYGPGTSLTFWTGSLTCSYYAGPDGIFQQSHCGRSRSFARARAGGMRVYHRSMALVEVDAVWKGYTRRAGLRTEMQHVVEGVSLTVKAGEALGLVGESGSGKTTLARMILGLTEPSRGKVRVDGIVVARASRVELRRLRRQMQPVFQDPYAALNPRMNVLEIVTEPLVIHGREAGFGKGKAALRARAVELLGEVGLDEAALSRHPHEFSGGQRQ